MGNRAGGYWRAGALTALALLVATPVAAQQFESASTSFLKAVRDRDGTKAQAALDVPANTMISARDQKTGDTALHIVTKRRDMQWLQFMLAKGADRDARDNQGMTPLADAAQLGWVEGAQQLLDIGASVDLADDHGETPLILATQAHSVPMVKLLVDRGADPHATDSVAGMSAIDYAKRDGRSDAILRLLESAQVKPKRKVSGPSING